MSVSSADATASRAVAGIKQSLREAATAQPEALPHLAKDTAVLVKLLRNPADHPEEAKFRKIKLANAAIARVLGNIGYFLALLILSSKWRSDGNYVIMNTVMLVSLIAAAFVGSVVALPSYTNTASTFFVLWVMEKEMEIKWGSGWIAVLFVNFVALYFLAHHLHIHPEIITSLFDPLA